MKIIISKPKYVDRVKICKYLGEGSKFLGSWALKSKEGNWVEQPVDVFYNPNSAYNNKLVGFFKKPLDPEIYGLYVCDATSAASLRYMPCLVESDIVYISKYRHDWVETPEGRYIDGGRDYLRLHSNAYISTFLTLDETSGDFWLSTEQAHGYTLVNIEYEDENDTDK